MTKIKDMAAIDIEHLESKVTDMQTELTNVKNDFFTLQTENADLTDEVERLKEQIDI